jgi:hypothetical protein
VCVCVCVCVCVFAFPMPPKYKVPGISVHIDSKLPWAIMKGSGDDGWDPVSVRDLAYFDQQHEDLAYTATVVLHLRDTETAVCQISLCIFSTFDVL